MGIDNDKSGIGLAGGAGQIGRCKTTREEAPEGRAKAGGQSFGKTDAGLAQTGAFVDGKKRPLGGKGKTGGFLYGA